MIIAKMNYIKLDGNPSKSFRYLIANKYKLIIVDGLCAKRLGIKLKDNGINLW